MHTQISIARQCECMHDNTEQHCIQISTGKIIMSVIFSRVHDASLHFDQCLKSDVVQWLVLAVLTRKVQESSHVSAAVSYR